MRILSFCLLCMTIPAGLLRAQGVADISELETVGKVVYLDGKPFTGTVLSRSGNQDEPIGYTVTDGISNGVLTGYYDEERTHVKWQVPMSDGLQNGLYVHYYENGNINFTVPRIRNKMQGTRHCYREDGTLWHIHHYRDGLEHGLKVMYYPDGEIWQEVTYRKDLMHGPARVYHPGGALKRTGRFKKGKACGKWKESDESGNLLVKQKVK